ncbi:MAG: cell division protein FtsA [Myxococcales bacterium]|nr:cell division protein FtsA [Myxococcales bacterium]MCB9643206.1 cell division protein FtsA [Myxococcales bacterium]
MMKHRTHRDVILAGLDVGTSKTCVVVGELTEDGDIDVIGVGSHPSRGVTKGQITDIEETRRSIREAIKEAEMMAGCSIHEVFVNVSGSHIRSSNSSGVVPLPDRVVRDSDIRKVLEAARAVQFDQNVQLLHMLPQEYEIDEQDGIVKPLGMSGVRMEARVHLVTAASARLENITRCVQQSQLRPSSLILNAIASSEALLHEDERDLGVALVDIGAGTTDIAIIEHGSIVHTAVLPVGGDQITNDIATSLHTPSQEAETIKMRYGCASTALVRGDETFLVPGVAGRRPREQSRFFLAGVIEPRVEEIFSMIGQELRKSGYENGLASGLVLTGGCTKLEGVFNVAEEITGLPVRQGLPQNHIGGLTDVVRSPVYSTAIGLLLHGLRLQQDPHLGFLTAPPGLLGSFKTNLQHLYQRVAAFFT